MKHLKNNLILALYVRWLGSSSTKIDLLLPYQATWQANQSPMCQPNIDLLTKIGKAIKITTGRILVFQIGWQDYSLIIIGLFTHLKRWQG